MRLLRLSDPGAVLKHVPFSIDDAAGNFLGECGAGLADRGQRAMACEIWLFDKNANETMTKVLMGDFAYNSPDVQARLAHKGETALARPQGELEMRTGALKMRVRVTELDYDDGERRFFKRVTLALAVWQKRAH